MEMLKIMVTDGETYATMADEFGTTKNVIINTMRKYHIPTYAKMQKTSDIKYEEWELCELYRKSSDKQYQLRILSELNCMPVEQILDILKFNGEDLSDIDIQKLFDDANKKIQVKKRKQTKYRQRKKLLLRTKLTKNKEEQIIENY